MATSAKLAALVAVSDGDILFASTRFVELSESGPWRVGGRRYATLRALAIAEAKKASPSPVRVVGRDRLLVAHVERSRQQRKAVTLLSFEDVAAEARRDDLDSPAALVRRERLRLLGELAATVAHDLGNTLRGASFQASLLESHVLPPERLKEAIASVRQRIELASQAVTRLHEFARTGALTAVSAVRLDEVLRQAAAIVQVELDAASPPVRLVIRAPRLPVIRAAPSELSYLFVNLFRNAREAMSRGGTITATARVRGGRIVISVLDEGAGFARSTRDHVFEPFFTTKGAAGTGLGLWLARSTMERIGGTIVAANRRGARGAAVVLAFPLPRLPTKARPSLRKVTDATMP